MHSLKTTLQTEHASRAARACNICTRPMSAMPCVNYTKLRFTAWHERAGRPQPASGTASMRRRAAFWVTSHEAGVISGECNSPRLAPAAARTRQRTPATSATWRRLSLTESRRVTLGFSSTLRRTIKLSLDCKAFYRLLQFCAHMC